MAVMTIETLVMTPEDVGIYIGCSAWKIKELSRLHEIPFYKIGKLYKYKKSSIDKWVNKQEEKNYKA